MENSILDAPLIDRESGLRRRSDTRTNPLAVGEWLPGGKLTILAGDGGTGKTTLTINLAATITVAGKWPDQTDRNEAGNVIAWSSEDDFIDTLTPRFIAAGANLDRVHFINGARTPDGESVPFDPARDIAMLHNAIASKGGVDLLIIDPVISAITGDMYKANDVRRSLQSIVDLAGAHDCAVIGISHYAKGSKGSSPADRVIGSQVFAALARIVLVTAKKEDSVSVCWHEPNPTSQLIREVSRTPSNLWRF